MLGRRLLNVDGLEREIKSIRENYFVLSWWLSSIFRKTYLTLLSVLICDRGLENSESTHQVQV